MSEGEEITVCGSSDFQGLEGAKETASHYFWAIYRNFSRRLVTPNGGERIRESCPKCPKHSG